MGRGSLPPVFTVKGAELDGLGNMLGLNHSALRQIGNGTGHSQDAVMATGR